MAFFIVVSFRHLLYRLSPLIHDENDGRFLCMAGPGCPENRRVPARDRFGFKRTPRRFRQPFDTGGRRFDRGSIGSMHGDQLEKRFKEEKGK